MGICYCGRLIPVGSPLNACDECAIQYLRQQGYGVTTQKAIVPAHQAIVPVQQPIQPGWQQGYQQAPPQSVGLLVGPNSSLYAPTSQMTNANMQSMLQQAQPAIQFQPNAQLSQANYPIPHNVHLHQQAHPGNWSYGAPTMTTVQQPLQSEQYATQMPQQNLSIIRQRSTDYEHFEHILEQEGLLRRLGNPPLIDWRWICMNHAELPADIGQPFSAVIEDWLIAKELGEIHIEVAKYLSNPEFAKIQDIHSGRLHRLQRFVEIKSRHPHSPDVQVEHNLLEKYRKWFMDLVIHGRPRMPESGVQDIVSSSEQIQPATKLVSTTFPFRGEDTHTNPSTAAEHTDLPGNDQSPQMVYLPRSSHNPTAWRNVLACGLPSLKNSKYIECGHKDKYPLFFIRKKKATQDDLKCSSCRGRHLDSTCEKCFEFWYHYAGPYLETVTDWCEDCIREHRYPIAQYHTTEQHNWGKFWDHPETNKQDIGGSDHDAKYRNPWPNKLFNGFELETVDELWSKRKRLEWTHKVRLREQRNEEGGAANTDDIGGP